MRNTNKKGFTIVELVIVIAVIAILAAVLIPVFSGIIAKSKESSDIRAVRDMNTALAANEAVAGKTIFDAYDALEGLGLTGEDYKPLASGMYFFWDSALNRVLYVDESMTVVAPKEYAGNKNTNGTWISLTQTIESEAPAGYVSGAATVNVGTGAELMYVVEDLRKGNINANGITINLTANIDMMGANMTIWTGVDGSGVLSVTNSVTINGNGYTIKNTSAIDNGSWEGDGHSEAHDGIYNASALFAQIYDGTVTINNLTVDNAHVKNTQLTNVAILISSTAGDNTSQGGTRDPKVILNDVSVTNSTAIGWRNVGALIGLVGLEVEVKMTDVDLTKVNVGTVGGRSGMLIGYSNVKVNVTDTVDLTDCVFDIHRCDQNKQGENITIDGTTYTLGLTNSGITSWAYLAEGGKEGKENQVFSTTMLNGSTVNAFDTGKVPGWN